MSHRGIAPACIVAVLSASCSSGVDAEVAQQLLGEIDAGISAAEALDARRVDALRKLAAAPEVVPSRCDRSVVLADGGLEPSAAFRLDAERGNFRIVPLAELAPGTGVRITYARDMTETYRRRLEPGAQIPVTDEEVPEIRKRFAALGRPEAWFRHEITLVTVQHVEPRVVRKDLFEGGFTKGRIAVFDYAAGEIACAAEVKAATESVEEVGSSEKVVQDIHLSANVRVRYRDSALDAIGVQQWSSRE